MNRVFLPFLLLLAWGQTGCLEQAASQQLATTSDPGSTRPAEAGQPIFDEDWGKNARWDDGKAEVATYEARRSIYGQARQFDYTFVVVKEVFNRAYGVKTDDYRRDDLFEVFKLNMFGRIPTNNYPYHFLTSAFVRRDQPTELYKLTHSSQEWCGNVFKEFKPVEEQPDKLRYVYHSYWDGQGDGQQVLDRDFLFEDQLPLTLRTLNFRDGLTFTRQLLPTEVSSKAYEARPLQATFSVQKSQVEAMGQSRPAWKVSVAGATRNTYWLGIEYPHYLYRMEASDGRSLQLRDLKRWAYWQF